MRFHTWRATRRTHMTMHMVRPRCGPTCSSRAPAFVDFGSDDAVLKVGLVDSVDIVDIDTCACTCTCTCKICTCTCNGMHMTCMCMYVCMRMRMCLHHVCMHVRPAACSLACKPAHGLTYTLAHLLTCTLTKATKLTRHRVQNQWAGHIKYASLAAADVAHIRLRFGACASLPPY